MTKVFIIVLNYNGGQEVLGCLKSLAGEGRRLSWRGLNILVVDNASSDGSVEKIKKMRFPKTKILENKKNLGFAAGNNVGIKYALRKGAGAVMLLNQDTIVQKGFLRPLLESKVDIVAPVIKFKREKKWVYDHGGRINWWLGRASHTESNASSLGQLPKIDYVSGCAMLIKRKVFDKIGLLDEKYFLYFEDVDFCLKARKAGFEIAVEPKSSVVHKLKEKEKKPLRQHFNLIKSNFTFINCWVPIWKKPLAYLFLLALTIKTLARKLI